MLRCPQWGLSSQSLGKYWQLNQSNQHTSTYSRIQQQTKNPYYVTIHNEYTQENPRINRQDRRKVTFPGSAYHKEISQQCTPATHTEAIHCQGVLLGVFHPCLWPLKAPGSTSPSLVNLLTPVPPQYTICLRLVNRKRKHKHDTYAEVQTESPTGRSWTSRRDQHWPETCQQNDTTSSQLYPTQTWVTHVSIFRTISRNSPTPLQICWATAFTTEWLICQYLCFHPPSCGLVA